MNKRTMSLKVSPSASISVTRSGCATELRSVRLIVGLKLMLGLSKNDSEVRTVLGGSDSTTSGCVLVATITDTVASSVDSRVCIISMVPYSAASVFALGSAVAGSGRIASAGSVAI